MFTLLHTIWNTMGSISTWLTRLPLVPELVFLLPPRKVLLAIFRIFAGSLTVGSEFQTTKRPSELATGLSNSSHCCELMDGRRTGSGIKLKNLRRKAAHLLRNLVSHSATSSRKSFGGQSASTYSRLEDTPTIMQPPLSVLFSLNQQTRY
jgi:hypothetical protein